MADSTGSAQQFEQIERNIEQEDYAAAESALKQLLNKDHDSDSELREHERALTTLGSLYKKQK